MLCVFQVQPRNRMAVEDSELMVVKLVLLPLCGEIYNRLMIKAVIYLIVNMYKRVIIGNCLSCFRFIGIS